MPYRMLFLRAVYVIIRKTTCELSKSCGSRRRGRVHTARTELRDSLTCSNASILVVAPANDPSRVTVSAPGCAAAIATTERVAACSVQALRAVEEGQGASEHSNQRCKQFCAQEEGFRAASVVAAHTRREKGKASTGAPCNESRESAFGNKSVECMFKVDASLPGSRPDSPSESPTDIRSDMPKDSLSGMTHLPEYTTVPAEMGERRTSSEPPGMNLQPCGFHAPVQVAITQAAVVGYGSVSGQSSVFMVRATTAVAQQNVVNWFARECRKARGTTRAGIDDQAYASWTAQGQQFRVPASRMLSFPQAVVMPAPGGPWLGASTERSHINATPRITVTSTGNLPSSSSATACGAPTRDDDTQEP
ncbi:hypothetical protein PC123_g791 [Phytophthora cactorum]|nr:hypothetical protein PC123_g791 [Phytophthora cactorum]